MATELEFVLSKLPGYIDTSLDSTFYNVIKAFVDELMLLQGSIDELHAMIGVDTTYGEDLDIRWGALLNLPRNNGETDDEYRYRKIFPMNNIVDKSSEYHYLDLNKITDEYLKKVMGDVPYTTFTSIFSSLNKISTNIFFCY